ncbi:MAG TPA: hypothetical protein VLA93_17575 [Pyrinomonadaceae bacterium]|nr:hypothetical protein [Pyrinomonadaceae bacterium]
MLNRLFDRFRGVPQNTCVCTLAVHPPYRHRAQLLIADAPAMPWIVFTDEPNDFIDLGVRAIRYEPTGPMAIDFVTKLPPTGDGRGRPAYHDKRFLLQTVLEEFDSAIFIDADSRIRSVPRLPHFVGGIAANKAFMESITKHLNHWGQSRRPAFEQLAVELIGNANALNDAQWVSECLFAVTKDGNDSKFFAAWERGAKFLHSRNLFTGEGGVIGLAAAYAGWTVDYRSLVKLAAATEHEGGGPKTS